MPKNKTLLPNPRNLAIGITLLVILVTGSYLMLTRKPTNVSKTIRNEKSTNIFETSNNLNFSIEVSDAYSIEERSVSVNLIKGNNSVRIGRSCTNFNGISEYLNDLDIKNNKTENTTDENISINGYQTITRQYHETTNLRKIYFIMVGGCVYNLSTTTPDLYPDLDQIAHSFQYTGDTTN